MATCSACSTKPLIGVQESHSELRSYLDRLELDPERFNELESRLPKAINLARKHHVKPAELAHHHQELAADLPAQTRRRADVEAPHAGRQPMASALAKAFVQAAEALSQSRQRYAEELGAKVSASMHELAMPDGRFAIEVRPDAQSSLSPLGIDRVEFMVTTNPGQPIQPLGKVASGGELSRISLAIVVISARKISPRPLSSTKWMWGSAARPPPWWAACCASSANPPR